MLNALNLVFCRLSHFAYLVHECLDIKTKIQVSIVQVVLQSIIVYQCLERYVSKIDLNYISYVFVLTETRALLGSITERFFAASVCNVSV